MHLHTLSFIFFLSSLTEECFMTVCEVKILNLSVEDDGFEESDKRVFKQKVPLSGMFLFQLYSCTPKRFSCRIGL